MDDVVRANQIELDVPPSFATMRAQFQEFDLTDTEIDQYWIGCRNGRQKCRLTPANEVPLVDLLEPNDSGERRVDAAVTQIQSRLSNASLCGGQFSTGSLNGVFDRCFDVCQVSLLCIGY